MASLSQKNEIFDNLTIINFNYDRCIEHYLFHVMQRLYPSKGEGHLTGLLNQKLKILHPYGLVGNLPWQSRTNFVQFGGGAGNNLAALSNQIRTYNEEVDDKQKIADIRGALAEAQRICFLVFISISRTLNCCHRPLGTLACLAKSLCMLPRATDHMQTRKSSKIGDFPLSSMAGRL